MTDAVLRLERKRRQRAEGKSSKPQVYARLRAVRRKVLIAANAKKSRGQWYSTLGKEAPFAGMRVLFVDPIYPFTRQFMPLPLPQEVGLKEIFSFLALPLLTFKIGIRES